MTKLVGPVTWPNDLRFRRYIQKYNLPPVLTFLMMSQLSKLMEWLKHKTIEYLKNGAWLFREITFLNYAPKTTFLEVIVLAEVNFKNQASLSKNHISYIYKMSFIQI